jgi:moderate conductance mechanosensitive channel
MDWGQYFNSESLLALALPLGIGIAIFVVLYFLRRYLYSFIHKLTAKTRTCFDDILVHETRIATLLWCLWLGIYAAYKIAETPVAWIEIEEKVIPVLFVSIGIYSAIMIIMATLKWYKKEICPRTSSSLDEIIMSTLIFGTPIIGGALGLIQILNMLNIKNDVINSWLGEHLAGLAFLAILAITLLLLTILIVPKIINAAVRNVKAEQTEEELKKREETLTSVIVTTLQIVIIFIFVLTVVGQLISWTAITPVLTATGVVGVAIGFGAQSLVKDVISGLFIIMENQYRKGDVIKIAGESGAVEEINLRRTILRDMDGVYHVVPNGEIKVASNYTKQWSRVNFNIGVSYDTDLDKAIAVINQVGKEIAEDPQWSLMIISPPRAVRVDNLGDSSVDIRIVGETRPSRQWDVTGELRLRLKRAFDKEGIEIPFPHTKVIFENPPPRLWPEVDEIDKRGKSQPKKPN